MTNLSKGSGSPNTYEVSKFPYFAHAMACSTSADFDFASEEASDIPWIEMPWVSLVSVDDDVSTSNDHSYPQESMFSEILAANSKLWPPPENVKYTGVFSVTLPPKLGLGFGSCPAAGPPNSNLAFPPNIEASIMSMLVYESFSEVEGRLKSPLEVSKTSPLMPRLYAEFFSSE